MTKEVYLLRLEETIKQRCHTLGADIIRDIIEHNTEFKTDNNMKLLVIKNDIEIITLKRDKLLKDISYYEKQVELLKNSVKEYDNIIKSKNEQLREIIDMKELEEKEFKALWSMVETLINEKRLDEVEMQEVWENIKYSNKKEVSTNIIMKMKKENMDKKYIDVVEKSL